MNLKSFRKQILNHDKKYRRDFPWRRTHDPYRIMVSEIMLQQTQADRVVEKYQQFIAKFPTVQKLAAAKLKTVLTVWQGLGYNRRAKMLHDAARLIVKEHQGVVPRDTIKLEALPGIGPYTARAIATFAFNQPHIFIETNIRSVFIHEFFPKKKLVSDAVLLPLIEQTLDQKNPRAWYTALMDYGAMLKKTKVNPSRKSKHYVRQSAFKGSDREVRGAIIKLLTVKKYTEATLVKTLPFASTRVKHNLNKLVAEQLVKKRNHSYTI